MNDTIEVKPRYFEPEASNQQMLAQQTVAVGAASPSASLAKTEGLFTSIYENRIIVLIIVVVIIVVAFIAYVVYSRDPAEPKPAAQQSAQSSQAAAQQSDQTAPQSAQQPVQTTQAAVQPTQQSTQTNQTTAQQSGQSTTQQPTQLTPPKPANNLEELLSRSRHVEAESMQNAQVMNMKSEEEIMHLMEDQSSSASISSNKAPDTTVNT